MWNPLVWILLLGICITQAVPIEEKAPRDSYGKLIQAKNTIDGKKIAQTDDGIEFQVPSYASGIVVPEPYNDLLPPLTSSEKLEAGSADSEIIYIENVGGSSNNIRDGKSIGSYQKEYTDVITTNFPIREKTAVTVEESIEVPYTDLNPPYFDNEKRYSTDSAEPIEAAEHTEHVEIPLYDSDVYKGGFGGPSGILGNQKSVGTYHQQKHVAIEINSALTDLVPVLFKAAVKNSDELLYDGDIYKGGFGGSSGVLGNQESIGTYHQEKDSATDINSELTTLIPPLPAVIAKNIKNSDELLYDGDIYKGGFGGSSGVLGNQESIGTYHQAKDSATDINSELTTLIPPLPAVIAKNIKNSDELLYDGDIYKGGFGGASGILGKQALVGTYHQMKTGVTNKQSSTSYPITKSDTKLAVTNIIPGLVSSTKENIDNSLYNGDIYKGGFGGPSGLLGKQNLPGTFYQNQNNDKVKKIANENTTENIKIIQLQTTTRPTKKIVSRFEFSSIQKPVLNINTKKHEEKKSASISDDINKGGKGKLGTSHQNKNYSTYMKIETSEETSSTIINPPSIDLLPPLEETVAKQELDKSTDKSLYDGDIYKGGFGGPSEIMETQKKIENYQEKNKVAPKIDDSKTTQNDQTKTEMYNVTESTEKTNEMKSEIIPINFENDAVTLLPTDLIPPLVDSNTFQETSTANAITYENNGVPSPILKNTIFGVPHKTVENIKNSAPLADLNTVSIISKEESNKDMENSTPNLNSASLSIQRSITNAEADKNTEKSLYEGDIYKGGFGGPVGFLGEQMTLGIFRQETSLENQNEAKIITTTEGAAVLPKNEATTTSSKIINTNSPVQNLISDIPLIRVSLNSDAPPLEVNTKSFLSSPITTSTLSLQSTTPEPPSIFFTPPFFSPKPAQEQTLLTQKGTVPSYSPFSEKSSPVLGQRFDNNDGKKDFVNDFVFTDNVNKFSPPLQQQQSNIAPNTFNVAGLQSQQVFTIPVNPVRIDNLKEPATSLNNFNNFEAPVTPINLNAFGNIQGFKSPQFLSSIGTISNNKFTGNFGGAPGVLGNQKQPGYGVLQDNVVVTQPHFEPPSATVVLSNNKYNGGFGGPPGLLSPFDNKSK